MQYRAVKQDKKSKIPYLITFQKLLQNDALIHRQNNVASHYLTLAVTRLVGFQ